MFRIRMGKSRAVKTKKKKKKTKLLKARVTEYVSAYFWIVCLFFVYIHKQYGPANCLFGLVVSVRDCRSQSDAVGLLLGFSYNNIVCMEDSSVSRSNLGQQVKPLNVLQLVQLSPLLLRVSMSGSSCLPSGETFVASFSEKKQTVD